MPLPIHENNARIHHGRLWAKLSGEWFIPSYTEVQLPQSQAPPRFGGAMLDRKVSAAVEGSEEITMTQDGKTAAGATTCQSPDPHPTSSTMWCSTPGEVGES